MKRFPVFNSFIFLLITIINGCSRQADYPELKNHYLGQKPPGAALEIFAPGIVTTDKFESAITVSPDLKEVYFIRKSLKIADNRIWYSRIEDEKLSIPQKAPFTYECLEGNPCFTRDGKRLYYVSQRPVPDQDSTSVWGNIWFVDKTKDGWSEPVYLDSPINDLGPHYLSIDNEGTLYFGSATQKCVYYAKLKDSGYPEAARMPEEINYLKGASHPGIAPDGSYLMVDYYWMENDSLKGSLFISFKKPDGSWTKAVDMRETLKITDSYIWASAMVTPDGKYIFIERYIQETQKADLYWISSKIIEELKPDYIKQEIK
ncbi:hypothetical protein ACFL6G_08865 [candidate division KSB1 bacterium]